MYAYEMLRYVGRLWRGMHTKPPVTCGDGGAGRPPQPRSAVFALAERPLGRRRGASARRSFSRPPAVASVAHSVSTTLGRPLPSRPRGAGGGVPATAASPPRRRPSSARSTAGWGRAALAGGVRTTLPLASPLCALLANPRRAADPRRCRGWCDRAHELEGMGTGGSVAAKASRLRSAVDPPASAPVRTGWACGWDGHPRPRAGAPPSRWSAGGRGWPWRQRFAPHAPVAMIWPAPVRSVR